MVAITRKHLLAGIVGGAVAGPLDLLTATAQFGAPLDVICKSVAGGWVGRDAAMAGGAPMVLLGFASDLGISIVAALIYCVVTPAREIARPWLSGTLFGLAMFTVMRFIITPLSAANHNPMPPLVLAESLLVHAFIFGLPVALVANFVLKPKD
ncbi:MAG: hypothetical protein HY859_20030 [Caulobacterales bacterium]|nr:hypothetical protein [Caulobacterales bacterium]